MKLFSCICILLWDVVVSLYILTSVRVDGVLGVIVYISFIICTAFRALTDIYSTPQDDLT